MVHRVLILITALVFAISPVATAHFEPHVKPQAGVQDIAEADHSEIDCEQPDCDDSNVLERESEHCGVASGHCSASLFRPDLWDVVELDWSNRVHRPSSDFLARGLNPESETPPPRTR